MDFWNVRMREGRATGYREEWKEKCKVLVLGFLK
jgi:hypothetical protein